jgi:hypothetical protein
MLLAVELDNDAIREGKEKQKIHTLARQALVALEHP